MEKECVCGEGGGSDRGGDGRESERMAHEQRSKNGWLVGWVWIWLLLTRTTYVYSAQQLQ